MNEAASYILLHTQPDSSGRIVEHVRLQGFGDAVMVEGAFDVIVKLEPRTDPHRATQSIAAHPDVIRALPCRSSAATMHGPMSEEMQLGA